MNVAESEVHACACTANLADYVKTLRESLCLATPNVEIRCDNQAAIVLATGEGPWKTESAAKKVYYLREQVEFGFVSVKHVGTSKQAADSLTKFLKGGPEQMRARELLPLDDVRIPQPGRRSAQACGISDRIQVCRICFSESEFGGALENP